MAPTPYILDRRIERLFNKGCTTYHLLADGDRILLALSGGKDSMALAALMVARARIYRPQIQVEAAHVVMENVPYCTDLNHLQQFCDELHLPLHVLRTSFDDSTDYRRTKCVLCARYRRRALFDFALQRGCNKVALGHHQDDFLATMLMNLVYEGSFHSMAPAMYLKHFGLTLIRPLCMVPEIELARVAHITDWVKHKAKCPYEDTTRRTLMEQTLQHLAQLHPEARSSMWHALAATWGTCGEVTLEMEK